MYRIIEGNSLAVLKTLPAESAHCCVTSPPYYGLRNYGVAGQIGLEKTPEEFVERLVEVFREVRRVLHASGTLWLNIGDSYSGKPMLGWRAGNPSKNEGASNRNGVGEVAGCKPKDLIGVPWLLAFALRADGWYLRSEIIWHKPSPMPESVTDRPTKSHEQIFLLAKQPHYFYDADAIAEDSIRAGDVPGGGRAARNEADALVSFIRPENKSKPVAATRNKRSVWTIAGEPFGGAHFATFPQKLVEPCILAGTSDKGCCPACLAPIVRIVERGDYSKSGRATERKGDESNPQAQAGLACIGGGYWPRQTVGWQASCSCNAGEPVACTVLEPFAGAGTTLLVAERLGRDSIGVELNSEYAAMARARVANRGGLRGVDPLPGQRELFA